MEQEKKECVICFNDSYDLVKKGGTRYRQCYNCKTVFCDALDNDNKVGGEYEEERNEKENHLRIERIGTVLKGIPKEDTNILDFGCGRGLLIDDLKKHGYKNVEGYDAYYEPYSRLPKREYYHLVNATEVFEHFATPFLEIDVIHRSLINGGAVIIETSFTNVANEENIQLEDFFYLNPDAGHSILYSHHGLDILMMKKGFYPKRHFNRHCRLYIKIQK